MILDFSTWKSFFKHTGTLRHVLSVQDLRTFPLEIFLEEIKQKGVYDVPYRHRFCCAKYCQLDLFPIYARRTGKMPPSGNT